MAKLFTVFTQVTCPVCRIQIDRKANRAALVQHIKGQHPTVSVRSLVQALLDELKLGRPHNVDEISSEELGNFLENMCQYKATKLGLERLRRQVKGK